MYLLNILGTGPRHQNGWETLNYSTITELQNRTRNVNQNGLWVGLIIIKAIITNFLNYEANFMQQNPSWQDNSHGTDQVISPPLWNLKIH
jgi:hypothetical protein